MFVWPASRPRSRKWCSAPGCSVWPSLEVPRALVTVPALIFTSLHQLTLQLSWETHTSARCPLTFGVAQGQGTMLLVSQLCFPSAQSQPEAAR